MSLKPSSLNEIRAEIAKIASQYGVFQCVQCSEAIKEFLVRKNIQGKQIKLDLGRQDLPWSVIYDLRREQQISISHWYLLRKGSANFEIKSSLVAFFCVSFS